MSEHEHRCAYRDDDGREVSHRWGHVERECDCDRTSDVTWGQCPEHEA